MQDDSADEKERRQLVPLLRDVTDRPNPQNS